MSLKTATAIIDQAALVDNFIQLKKMAPNSQILAVLKANAYGHGLERIAKALPEADAFGVARIDEALALRAAGIIKPIVLLEGFFDADDLAILAVNNFQTIVHNQAQLKALENAKLERPLKVWLKIDTGMHRLGINPEEFTQFYQTLVSSENVHDDLVLMSHLGCADDQNSQSTTQQLALFEQITNDNNCKRSLANSAGLCAWPKTHFDWVRPGLALFGVSPLIKENKLPLTPVMTLQSSVIAIRTLKPGEPVGYGAAWQSDRKTTIAVIAIGYGDGYPRHAKNGTPVLLNGRLVPLVGRVSMDMITVDLGPDAADKIGDIATLWGKGLSVAEVAKWATTIPYELLCNITRRVQIQVS